MCYFFVLDSYLRYNSCFSKIRPDTKIPIPANRIDHDNHLTDFPTEPDYQHDSRPVAVKPLNLQQATSDHPVNSPEIVADKSLQTECQVEHHKILTTAESHRIWVNTYNRLKKIFGREEASKLASVAKSNISNQSIHRRTEGSGMAKSTGCFTPLSFRTGMVRNPSGRDGHLSEHSPPCEVGPVKSMYGMTAESVVVS